MMLWCWNVEKMFIKNQLAFIVWYLIWYWWLLSSFSCLGNLRKYEVIIIFFCSTRCFIQFSSSAYCRRRRKKNIFPVNCGKRVDVILLRSAVQSYIIRIPFYHDALRAFVFLKFVFSVFLANVSHTKYESFCLMTV